MSALRPSNLPKLAVCPCYESNPVAGPAAERGTLLDSAFRAELLQTDDRRQLALVTRGVRHHPLKREFELAPQALRRELRHLLLVGEGQLQLRLAPCEGLLDILLQHLEGTGRLDGAVPLLVGGDWNCPSHLDWTPDTARAFHDEDLDVDTDFCAMCGHDWCSVRISKEISLFVSGKDEDYQWDKPKISEALNDEQKAILEQRGVLERSPLLEQVAAVSVGLVDGTALLDLDYSEDSRAAVDLNVVMNSQGQLLELQGTAEGAPFSRQQLNTLLDLAESGLVQLRQSQLQALEQAQN